MGSGENNLRNSNNIKKPQKGQINNSNSSKRNGKTPPTSGKKSEFFLKKFYFWLKGNAFWVGFLGTSLFMGGVVLTYNLLVEREKPKVEKVVKPYKPTLTELKKKVSEILKKNNQKILARVYKSSRPDIKKLEAENLKEVKKFIELKLTLYFEKVKISNVERFLNWFYTFGTDYKVIFKRLKDSVNSIKCKTGNVENCFQVSESEKYIATQIDKYLLNQKDLQEYMEREIAPYLRNKLEEFIQKSLEVVKNNYRKEAEKLLKEEIKDIPPDALKWFSQSVLYPMVEKTLKLTEVELTQRLKRKSEAFIGSVILTKISTKVIAKISHKLTVKIAQKVATKSAEKLGAKFLTGFGGGVLACAELGPFSLVCGLAAGVATSVAADYALTKLDEAITRDDMRMELIKLLDGAKQNLTLQLIEFHKTNLQAVEAILEELSQDPSYTLQQLGKQSF